jgi:hypothetical protein
MIKLIKSCSSNTGNPYDDAYLKLQRVPPFGIKTSSKPPSNRSSIISNNLSTL